MDMDLSAGDAGAGAATGCFGGGENYMLEILMTYVRSYVKNETGQALVEYALILALVSVASILVLTDLGTAIGDKLQTVVDELA
jgi:Flp pilus assembly pilin Flp